MAWFSQTLIEGVPPPASAANPLHDALPGFGCEFEWTLEKAFKEREKKEKGRLARYARYGMTELEARRRTPSPMREAYEALVARVTADDYNPNGDYTDSELSPSIPSTPESIKEE